MDFVLTLTENRRRSIGRARPAEGRARRLTTRYGDPTALARNLRMAIIQGAVLSHLEGPEGDGG